MTTTKKLVFTIGLTLAFAMPVFAAENAAEEQRELYRAEIQFRKQFALGLSEIDRILAHSQGRNASIKDRASRIKKLGQEIATLAPEVLDQSREARKEVKESEEQVREWEDQANLPSRLLTGLAKSATSGFLGMGTMGDVGVGVGAAGLTISTIVALMKSQQRGGIIRSMQESRNPMLAAAGSVGSAFVAPPMTVEPDDLIRDETRTYRQGPQGVVPARP